MEKISFWSSFGKSFIFIFLSEIGDETFLTILLYTSKLKANYLLLTSLLALFIMNFISIFLGRLASNFLKKIIALISTIVFIIYFIISIYKFCTSSDKSKEEELNEKKEGFTELKEEQIEGKVEENVENIKNKYNEKSKDNQSKNKLDQIKKVVGELKETEIQEGGYKYCKMLFIELIKNEIGDRSEVTTINMAAVYDYYGVLSGTMTAYFISTLFAILFGHLVIKNIKGKYMNLIYAFLFLVYALEVGLRYLGYL